MALQKSIAIQFNNLWQVQRQWISSAIVIAMFIVGTQAGPSSAGDSANPADKQDASTSSKSTVNEAGKSDGSTTVTSVKDQSQTAKAEQAELRYDCRVVDKLSKRGIPNARVTVRRSNYNSTGNEIIEETQHVTDEDGHYLVIIPSEQASLRFLYIELDVEHDEYSAKKGFGYALSMIRKNERLGERPFFEETGLYPGAAVTGTVVTPEGKPAVGAKVQGYSMADRRDFESGSFNDTLTDSNGSFRLSLHDAADGVIWVLPNDFASVEKFLGKQRGDLGTIKLTEGVRVSGKVLSADGQPLEGLAVNIQFSGERDVGGLPVATSISRGVISAADGGFAFDPLPPGDYDVMPDEHNSDPVTRDRQNYDIPGVFARQKISLKEGAKSQSLVVQAVPHVMLTGQIYNSKGDKRRGHSFHLFGYLDGVWWFGNCRPDEQGTFVARVPHGLRETRAQVICNEHQSLRYRLGKGGPVENRPIDGVKLGTMNDDVSDFEIIYYDAPTVLILAIAGDQKPIADFRVVATYPWGEQRYVLKGELRSDVNFEHQPDGRYRSSQLLPDEEVTFTITAPGFEKVSKTMKFVEKETQELVVSLIAETTDAVKKSDE